MALFDLDRILTYKDKRGRDLEHLRSELLRLLGLVESVVVTDETWADLIAAVEGATRKSELRVVEDQVDAVVCAYVAWYADQHPDRVTRYGDAATGVIVTPTLGLPAVASRDSAVRQAVQTYAEQHPALVAAATRTASLIGSMLDEAGINYLNIEGRAKSIASFAEKATRAEDGRPLYADPLHDIGDQLGIRVITYVRDDVEAVAGLLAEQVPVLDDRDFGELTASQGRFGYASRHLQLEIDGRVVQVQLRTVLQHAWAEFEHDIRYKGTVPPEHASEFDRRFTLAAGLLELADQEFSEIRAGLRGSASTALGDDDPRIAAREVAAFLAGQYPDAGWSRTDHYAWMSAPPARARHHHARGARRPAARHRRAADPRPDGLPLPARRRPPPRRRPARRVRRPLRRAAEQRPPHRAADRPPGAAAWRGCLTRLGGRAGAGAQPPLIELVEMSVGSAPSLGCGGLDELDQRRVG